MLIIKFTTMELIGI